VALLGLVLLLALGGTIGRTGDRFWERIQQSGRWRIGMDPSFPPFEDLDPTGRPVGFDVDLAEAIAGRWGVQLEIESIGFDGLIDAVWASRVDSVISAMPLQPQFSEDVAFSQPYFEAGLVMVTGVAEQDEISLDNLEGRTVAVEWGSEGDVQARQLQRQFPDLQILPMETPQEALAGLLAGQADIALVDRVSALQSVMSGQSVRIDPEPLVSDPYVIVLPRKAPILQREVGAALEALQADGTLDVLTNKWFGIPSP
jgi:polar amino acid transport system substrate-binding protein